MPAFSSWKDFVSSLTEAFRPVELTRRYIEQMLSISQGKQDMRSYIASFNALRQRSLMLFLNRHSVICFCRDAGLICKGISAYNTPRPWLSIFSMLLPFQTFLARPNPLQVAAKAQALARQLTALWKSR
jgi:hypothetical protein